MKKIIVWHTVCVIKVVTLFKKCDPKSDSQLKRKSDCKSGAEMYFLQQIKNFPKKFETLINISHSEISEHMQWQA